ncbi:hypothetical protein METHB2_50015 [Candidatus Methylobacter favarea]|uniref:Uncharacterized protein n=1 Tax=Candidatus Methylobacter favarea TaxID=2707345 RepID=A0A8S0X910_9GAMM|nr:hypothetical protein [Candidatus Methylobacter favarea]CAA9891744.1 hypothetical protein METHB2_50015 [Candidatus Methylobacter favarea]
MIEALIKAGWLSRDTEAGKNQRQHKIQGSNIRLYEITPVESRQ